MPNQAKPKAGSIPNLAGIIKAEDLYKKMKFDYVPWAKTAQLLREHADGWMFHLQSNKTQNDLFETLDDTVLDFSETNPFGDVGST